MTNAEVNRAIMSLLRENKLPLLPSYVIDRDGRRMDMNGTYWKFNVPIHNAAFDWGRQSDGSVKQDDLAEIITALHEIRAGRQYYPPGFQSDERVDERTKFIGARINSISPKEFEALRHFIRGESVKEVAETMKRSVKTVSGQRFSAMCKLSIRTDQELIAFCVESGLFQ